ncbi:hypothetical protein NFHSH190041_36920 (plasmid) [Shewanella sp. NFH-SH190041]|uniref:hypothetical protein n=1 Tax=Shewanella sp. NFH-SH190041 TaxID=2950245 RepID=UPI0021C4751B|nr:hypothetical protein [Shewanella sp. NFH-SH190041]BDM66240.1 hypothetical protein NFHSH190041_36920 [Shewanella sp. NFH-SH190041]
MFYGLVSQAHAIQIAQAVCRCLGNGRNKKADLLLIETACAETQLGTFMDPSPDGAGRGVTQIDSETFYWLKEKALELAPGSITRFKRSWRNKIARDFGIDVKRVEHSDLDYNPLLAFIWARLRYLVVAEAIPVSREARAAYWKKYFNSYHPNAAGTVIHYLESCETLLEDL